MNKSNFLILTSLLVISAALSLGVDTGSAQSREAEQAHVQPVQCDGSARSTGTKGMQRSTSNCDRKAAAERTVARRAAAAAGRPSPDQIVPDQTVPDEAAPSDEGGTDE